MHWKYEADKNLVKRDAFKWTIVRPGGLSNNPGTGKADIGRAHLEKTISVSLLFIFSNFAIDLVPFVSRETMWPKFLLFLLTERMPQAWLSMWLAEMSRSKKHWMRLLKRERQIFWDKTWKLETAQTWCHDCVQLKLIQNSYVHYLLR